MPKKSEGMSNRQKQSQRLMREKLARKKREERMRKIIILGGTGFIVLVSVLGVTAWKSGWAERKYLAATDGLYNMTAKNGFSVKSLYLDGRSRTSMEDIEKALDIKKGDPILKLSLGEIQQRLESVESIKMATVERDLPGRLYVHIVEREPVALWQYQAKIVPIDDNGVTMSDLNSKDYPNLPLVVGDDAPKHVKDLLTMLGTEPDLAKRFASAIWIGERRWNIRLDNGAEVKLPEENPGKAWKKLAELQQEQKLLDRDVKVIDLRIQGRLFITLPTTGRPAAKTAGAKDT